MSRYQYTDHILEAFNVFHRSMELEEVAGYVAEMEAKSVAEVRLAVDNTLTAAWLHGFLTRDDNQFTLACGYWDDVQRGVSQGDSRQKRHSVTRSKSYHFTISESRQTISDGVGLQDMNYGDQILSAFAVQRRPLTLADIVNYVSMASNKSPAEVYGTVRSTLDLALAHGFVHKQQDQAFLLAKELQQSL